MAFFDYAIDPNGNNSILNVSNNPNSENSFNHDDDLFDKFELTKNNRFFSNQTYQQRQDYYKELRKN